MEAALDQAAADATRPRWKQSLSGDQIEASCPEDPLDADVSSADNDVSPTLNTRSVPVHFLNAGQVPGPSAKIVVEGVTYEAVSPSAPNGVSSVEARIDLVERTYSKQLELVQLQLQQQQTVVDALCDQLARSGTEKLPADYLSSGCTAHVCRHKGFSAADCKRAGYSALDCRLAGFAARDCMEADFSGRDCRDAGLVTSTRDCKVSGFSADACKDAGFTARECKDAGYTAEDCRAAGYSAKDCRVAGYEQWG